MGVELALLAACSFALGTVLQQKGTLETTDGSGTGRWLLQILHKPVWLSGMVLQSAGWVLQGFALARAPLMVVQSLTTLSIVLALPLGAWLTRQVITRNVVLGAAAVVVGIVLFLTAGSPHGGTLHPAARTWWLACLVTFAAVLVLAVLGWRRTGATRAVLFGSAAGFGYALQTAVTKEFVTVIGGGIVALLVNWTVYVLIASALVGFVLQQSALKTGVLAPAMASSNTVTLFFGVLLGSVVYGETLARGDGRLVPSFVGLGVALLGVVFLSGAAAPSDAPVSAAVSRETPA